MRTLEINVFNEGCFFNKTPAPLQINNTSDFQRIPMQHLFNFSVLKTSELLDAKARIWRRRISAGGQALAIFSLELSIQAFDEPLMCRHGDVPPNFVDLWRPAKHCILNAHMVSSVSQALTIDKHVRCVNTTLAEPDHSLCK